MKIKTRFKLAKWEEIAIRNYGATQLRRIVTPHPPERYVEVYPETVRPGIPEWLWSRATSGQGAEQQDLFWLREKPVERIGDIIVHTCSDGSRIVLKVSSVKIGRAIDVTEDEATRCGIPLRRENWRYQQPVAQHWNSMEPEMRVAHFWSVIVKKPQAYLATRRVWKIDVEVLNK